MPPVEPTENSARPRSRGGEALPRWSVGTWLGLASFMGTLFAAAGTFKLTQYQVSEQAQQLAQHLVDVKEQKKERDAQIEKLTSRVDEVERSSDHRLTTLEDSLREVLAAEARIEKKVDALADQHRPR